MYNKKNKTIFVLFRTWNNKKVLFGKGIESNENIQDLNNLQIIKQTNLKEV